MPEGIAVTTVVYFDGVLAADRLCAAGSRREGMVRKIAKRKSDGALIGGCGSVSIVSEYIDWFLKGERGKSPSLGEDDKHDAEMIVVRPGRKVYLYDRTGKYQLKAKAIAMGSGCEYAYGALEMGAGAIEAVKIAIRRDAYSGGGVNAYAMA